MGTYRWNTLYSKILPAKSCTWRRRLAAQGPPSQAVHQNLATGPKELWYLKVYWNMIQIVTFQRKFKNIQQHSRFWTGYFGETLLCPQWKVAEFWLIDPLLELDVDSVLLSKLYDSVLETPRTRMLPMLSSEVDQSVTIRLTSAEDGEGFLRNIRFKNVSVVAQF